MGKHVGHGIHCDQDIKHLGCQVVAHLSSFEQGPNWLWSPQWRPLNAFLFTLMFTCKAEVYVTSCSSNGPSYPALKRGPTACLTAFLADSLSFNENIALADVISSCSQVLLHTNMSLSNLAQHWKRYP